MRTFWKMITFWVISVFLLENIAQGQEFGLIGDAYEAFSPCKNGYLTMERIIGKPPSIENYWDGFLDLEKFENLPEARVTLQINAPATVTLDAEDGRVNSNGDTFNLSVFKKNSTYKRVKFTVQGEQSKGFPNVESLKLNGVDICPNPSQWKPSILGVTNQASIGTGDQVGENVPTERTCGRRIIAHQGLITNNWPTQEGEWPWHAALFHQDTPTTISYKCGGTLISSDTVLTAGHCLVEGASFITAERLVVKLGQFHRILSNRNTQEFRVYRIIVHQEFDFGDFRNDIALLKLATQANFTAYVQPACLWTSDEVDLSNVVDKVGTVIGWGYDENEKPTDFLMQGSMPVVSLTSCLNSNRDFFGKFLSDRNFCAGYRNYTSACNGDSGGGLFFKKGDEYRIRGIVSLSVTRANKQVCDSTEYILFTDVAKYLEWIKTN